MRAVNVDTERMAEALGLVWEPPPGNYRGIVDEEHWNKVFDLLKRVPGEWARIKDGLTPPVHSRLARTLRLRYEGFEVTSRSNGSTGAVYARKKPPARKEK